MYVHTKLAKKKEISPSENIEFHYQFQINIPSLYLMFLNGLGILAERKKEKRQRIKKKKGVKNGNNQKEQGFFFFISNIFNLSRASERELERERRERKIEKKAIE